MNWPQLINRYALFARFLPAAIAIVPLASIFIILYSELTDSNYRSIPWLALAAIYFVMTQLGRDAGKKIENRLHASWGGKPTTKILRHSNENISSVTQQRYRDFLLNKINGLLLPDAQTESEDVFNADSIYESCTQWLIAQTRDHKRFHLLSEENISYGFRRNTLGLRHISLILCIGSLIISTILLILGHTLSTTLIACIGVQISCMLFFLFVVKPEWVKVPAEEYAKRLYEYCDLRESNL